MPCPLLIGMNPSPRFPETSWHPEAESTRILAEFGVGDAQMTCYLEDGLELDNLNPAVPESADKKMFVDAKVAHESLDDCARQGRLHDRLVVLLGDEVAHVFTTWAEIEPVPGDGASRMRSSPRLTGVDIRLARTPHPSRIAHLRRYAPKGLESAEMCFRSLGNLQRGRSDRLRREARNRSPPSGGGGQGNGDSHRDGAERTSAGRRECGRP